MLASGRDLPAPCLLLALSCNLWMAESLSLGALWLLSVWLS